MRVKVKHLHVIKRPDGELYIRHRVTGEYLGRTREAAAHKASLINARLAEQKERPPGGIGSIHDLIQTYRAHTDFTRLALATRKQYSKHLDDLDREYGLDMVKDMDREFALALQESLSATPRMADVMMAVGSRISRFAIDRPKRFGLTQNPFEKMGRLARPEGHKPWPPELVENFRKQGGELWRVVEFILNTGQRVGDAVSATWSDVTIAGFHVTQQKTGQALLIPFTTSFAATLETWPRSSGDYILFPSHADHWKRDWLIKSMAKQVKAFGFEGYTLHGLRYLAAQRLAEAGCTAHEIMAITGHKTLAMAQKYTAKGDQRAKALSAVKKLEGPKG